MFYGGKRVDLMTQSSCLCVWTCLHRPPNGLFLVPRGQLCEVFNFASCRSNQRGKHTPVFDRKVPLQKTNQAVLRKNLVCECCQIKEHKVITCVSALPFLHASVTFHWLACPSGGVMFHHGQRRLTEYIFRYSFLADGEGKSSSSQSTNHDAGHQTAAGSLLMYRCDSVCVCSLWFYFCFDYFWFDHA